MAFERYEKGFSMSAGRYRINGNVLSLYKDGKMSFNANAIINLELASYKSVWVHYDRETMELMLEFNPELSRGANTVNVVNLKLVLSLQGPMNFFGIPMPEKIMHLPIRKTDKPNVFIVKLPDGDAP